MLNEKGLSGVRWDKVLTDVPEIDIKDYLHLHLGCEVETNIRGAYIHPYGALTINELTPDVLDTVLYNLNQKEKNQAAGFSDSDHIYFKLKLYPLSSMTEEDQANGK